MTDRFIAYYGIFIHYLRIKKSLCKDHDILLPDWLLSVITLISVSKSIVHHHNVNARCITENVAYCNIIPLVLGHSFLKVCSWNNQGMLGISDSIPNQYLNISIINMFGHLYYVKIIDWTQIKCSLKIINPTSIWD